MTNLQIALIRYREKYNLNQTELASIIGCTRNALANWETGRTTPKAEVYKQIAEKLKCSLSYLMGEKEDDLIPTPSLNEQLKGVRLALFNQAGEITEEQAREVLTFIEFIKSRDSGK